MQPVFRQLDRHFLGESEHHSSRGELSVEAPRVRWDILDAIADAAEEMGIPKTPDFNTGDNTGSCYFHVNQKRGRRWSAARGFLKPVLGRPNLRLETEVAVEKVLFDGRRASGVRFRRGNEMMEARAKGEVILCAGAIGSVQLLQRSGIGPAEWLGELGIPVLNALEGVGRNLQDHLQLRVMYRVTGVKTLNEIYYSLLGPAVDGPAIWAVQARAHDHGGVTAWHLHQIRSRTGTGQYPVPRPAPVAGPVRHPAAPVSRHYRQPLQSAPHFARHRAPDLCRSGRPTQHPAQLSFHRRGPPHRRRCHTADAAADAPAGAGPIPAGGIPPRSPSITTAMPT